MMRKYAYCSVVSAHRLFKAIAMLESLNQHNEDYQIYVLCTDDEAKNTLTEKNLQNITILDIASIEDNDLRKARSNRSTLEYNWTLKPALLYHVVKTYPGAKYYALLDADLYYFEKLDLIFNEAPNASFYLTDHNNSKRFIHFYDLYGRYNTGFLGCTRSNTTLTHLNWWRKKCIELCTAKPDTQKKLRGTQRYIEDWPKKIAGTHVVKSPGANTASWNIERYKLTRLNNRLLVDNQPLVFYHFSGLGIYNSREFNLSHFLKLQENVVNWIYLPYVHHLSRIVEEICTNYPGFSKGMTKRGSIRESHYYALKSPE